MKQSKNNHLLTAKTVTGGWPFVSSLAVWTLPLWYFLKAYENYGL